MQATTIPIYMWRKLWLEAKAVNMNSFWYSKRKGKNNCENIAHEDQQRHTYTHTHVHMYMYTKGSFTSFSLFSSILFEAKTTEPQYVWLLVMLTKRIKWSSSFYSFEKFILHFAHPEKRQIKCCDIEVFNSYFSFFTFEWVVQLNFVHTRQKPRPRVREADEEEREEEMYVCGRKREFKRRFHRTMCEWVWFVKMMKNNVDEYISILKYIKNEININKLMRPNGGRFVVYSYNLMKWALLYTYIYIYIHLLTPSVTHSQFCLHSFLA